jgi:GMP synthase (glutamine-hydrolysing)
MLPICVVNNYGQFNHLIHRALRDLDLEVEMIPNTTSADKVGSSYRGIILGGGPNISRAGNCSQYLNLGLPVLGICLGLHIIATTFGGEVRPGKMGGYGFVEVNIHEHNEILAGYPDTIPVWASHADEVCRVPDGFTLLATSNVCPAEAIACPEKKIYGLQWHPEVSHTVDGTRIYENFNSICGE